MPAVPPFVNPFEKEEERFLIYLKEKIGGGWDELAERYAKRYPHNKRSKGGLQVHYSRSLQPGRKRRIELDRNNSHLPTSPTSDSAAEGAQEEDNNSSDDSDFEQSEDDRGRKQVRSRVERRAKLVKLKVNRNQVENAEMRVKHTPQSLTRPRRAAASGLKFYNFQDESSESPVSADSMKTAFEITSEKKTGNAIGNDTIMTKLTSPGQAKSSSSVDSPVCGEGDVLDVNEVDILQSTEAADADNQDEGLHSKSTPFEMRSVIRKDSVMNIDQYDDAAVAKPTSPTSYLRTTAVIDTGVWTRPSVQHHTPSAAESTAEKTFKKPAAPATFDLDAPPANSTRAKAIKLNLPGTSSFRVAVADGKTQAAKDAARRLSVRERLGLLPAKPRTLAPKPDVPIAMNFKAPLEKLKPLIKRPVQDDDDNDGPQCKRTAREIAIASREDPRLNPADDGADSNGWVEANLGYVRKYGRDSLPQFFLNPPAARVVEINVKSGSYRCKWRKEYSKDAIRSVGNIIIDDVFW